MNTYDKSFYWRPLQYFNDEELKLSERVSEGEKITCIAYKDTKFTYWGTEDGILYKKIRHSPSSSLKISSLPFVKIFFIAKQFLFTICKKSESWIQEIRLFNTKNMKTEACCKLISPLRSKCKPHSKKPLQCENQEVNKPCNHNMIPRDVCMTRNKNIYFLASIQQKEWGLYRLQYNKKRRWIGRPSALFRQSIDTQFAKFLYASNKILLFYVDCGEEILAFYQYNLIENSWKAENVKDKVGHATRITSFWTNSQQSNCRELRIAIFSNFNKKVLIFNNKFEFISKFEADLPYSHHFSPLFQILQRKYKLKTLVISSKDGNKTLNTRNKAHVVVHDDLTVNILEQKFTTSASQERLDQIKMKNIYSFHQTENCALLCGYDEQYIIKLCIMDKELSKQLNSFSLAKPNLARCRQVDSALRSHQLVIIWIGESDQVCGAGADLFTQQCSIYAISFYQWNEIGDYPNEIYSPCLLTFNESIKTEIVWPDENKTKFQLPQLNEITCFLFNKENLLSVELTSTGWQKQNISLPQLSNFYDEERDLTVNFPFVIRQVDDFSEFPKDVLVYKLYNENGQWKVKDLDLPVEKNKFLKFCSCEQTVAMYKPSSSIQIYSLKCSENTLIGEIPYKKQLWSNVFFRKRHYLDSSCILTTQTSDTGECRLTLVNDNHKKQEDKIQTLAETNEKGFISWTPSENYFYATSKGVTRTYAFPKERKLNDPMQSIKWKPINSMTLPTYRVYHVLDDENNLVEIQNQ